MTAGITSVDRSEWQRLGRIVGSAFVDDPVSCWTFGGDAATIVAVFTALGRHVYLPRGDCYLLGEAGGTMWLGPGAAKDLPLLPTIAVAARMVRSAGLASVRRALAVDAAMSARRPVVQHQYLFAVGVDAAHRGQGIGGRLLGPVLADCDRRGFPAYLENSNPANTGFYLGHGFEPGEAFSPAPGCPPLLPMWREARSPA